MGLNLCGSSVPYDRVGQNSEVGAMWMMVDAQPAAAGGTSRKKTFIDGRTSNE